MYFAGNIDISNGKYHDSVKSLRFPVRVPLEKIIRNVDSEKSLFNDTFGQSEVQMIACGGGHIIACISGVLYGMGNNRSRQLGSSSPVFDSIPYFRDLKLSPSILDSPIRQIACGRRHSLILTEKGNVLSTGDNSFNQLGHTNKAKDWSPVRVGGKVVQIACGQFTSFALTSEGHVYSWGKSEGLCLGHPMEAIEKIHPTTLLPIFVPIEFPTRIEALARRRVKVVDISVGNDHFVCRTDDDDVYTCGTNSYGRLGTGNVQDHPTPYRVKFDDRGQSEKVIQVAACATSTVVLKHNQDFGSVLYYFGKGIAGEGYLTPEIIDAPNNLVRIIGGHSSSCYYSLTTEGKVYAWGSHTIVPSLMLLNDCNRNSPSSVDVLDHICIKDISITGGQVILVTADKGATLRKYEGDAAKANAALLKDIIVPRDKRLRITHLSSGVDTYEEHMSIFMKLLLGESEGQAHFDSIEKAPPLPDIVKPSIVKKGTSAIRVGSKVRLWMTDVYALGKISRINTAAGTADEKVHMDSHNGSKNHSFEVTWERDDWDPEDIDLYSEDETLCEDNPNRWQKSWFLEPPAT
eukprot:Tbor_TRINITY_DN6583_c0_g1::TRINITY_DN6583_c0_g1_i1::g.7410::m.7410/K11494/RCBTB; RCC1 and BTB domain-containing protein